MKRQVVSVSRGLISTVPIFLLLALLVSSANAQFRFQRNYQQQYRPQQYSPYGQPQYQRYQQPNRYQQQPNRFQQQPNRFQQQPNQYQQYPNQFGQPYRPYQPRTVSQPQPSASTNTVTPESVLQYAIKSSEDYKTYPRLSGEFEKQKAVLLSVSDLQYQHNGILAEIIEKSSGHGVPFVILVNDDKQLKSTVELLDSIECDLSHVSLYRLKLDTIWLRDFGPRFAETKSGAQSIDFYYNGQRPLDDKFPISWGELSKDDVSRIKWTLQGGNMQSNGKGFAFVSSRLFQDNAIQLPHASSSTNVEFEKHKLVVDAFKKGCNIDQLLVLEPLRPEATKHVDMFATFVAEDTVVVADVDSKVDPQNAKVLEYNVNLLKQVKIDGEPLKIERIKFPPRNGKYWSPYTNIILANNLLLMPVYDSDPPAAIEAALDVYRGLLPDHHVDTVNMTTMQKLEGALHCMSINVPDYAKLPRGVMSMNQARAAVNKKGYVSKTKLNLSSTSKKPNKTPNRPQPKEKPEFVNSKKNSDSSRDLEAYKGSLNVANLNREPTPSLASEKPTDSDSESSLPPIVGPEKLAEKQPSDSESASPPIVDSEKLVEKQQLSIPKIEKSQIDESQVAAVMTYRRRFIDDSRRFSVDAYAVGLRSGRVLLRHVGNPRELALPIERLCEEDRKWLYKNANKIRRNGEKVKQFVISNGL